MRFVHDVLRQGSVDARQAYVEAGTQIVGAVSQIEVQLHLGIDGRVSREPDFPLARDSRHRA